MFVHFFSSQYIWLYRWTAILLVILFLVMTHTSWNIMEKAKKNTYDFIWILDLCLTLLVQLLRLHCFLRNNSLNKHRMLYRVFWTKLAFSLCELELYACHHSKIFHNRSHSISVSSLNNTWLAINFPVCAHFTVCLHLYINKLTFWLKQKFYAYCNGWKHSDPLTCTKNGSNLTKKKQREAMITTKWICTYTS